jgi:hypothetical protein
MDPYLESPDIWPDLHDRLAAEMSAMLNSTLPSPYYARLEMRPEIGIVEEEPAPRRIVPDVAVVRQLRDTAHAAVAVVEAARTSISPSYEVEIAVEPIRHTFVEIRDATRGHRLVTLIEIASPSNKRPGQDRKAYLRKQREVLDSDANLIELDLLRSGQRLVSLPLGQIISQLNPRPDYLALVNRAWRRLEETSAYQIFPVAVTESLPCIPVPLHQDRDEVPLDLQFIFQRAYDGGPYRRGAVAYDGRPDPALPEHLAKWADDRLRTAGAR